jgi:WD40 repeat protein
VTIARDHVVRVWSLAGQTTPGVTLRHPAKVNDAAFSTNAGLVVTVCEDGIARSWDSSSGRLLSESPKQDGPLMQLAFRPDGSLTTVANNHTAQVWDPVSLKPLHPPLVFTNFADASVPALCLSPDGQFMAELRRSGEHYQEKVEVWQIAPPRLLFARSRNQQFMGPLFSPNSRLLIVPARNDNEEAVYEVPGGRHVQLNWGQYIWLTRAVSPDSVRYATIDPSKRILTIGFLRPATNSITLRFPANLNDVAFSPDSTRCVTSSDDFSARVWDLEKHHQLGKVLHHERPVLSASWSPDGSLVATASKDQTARVWHVETGEPVTPPLRHDGAVNRVVFSRDGRRLLTIAEDRTVRIWSLSIDRQPTDGLRLMAWFMNSRAEEQVTGEPPESSFASPATTASTPDLKAWHERETEMAERNGRWFTVVFHLRRLLQIEPDNAQLKRRLTEAETRLAAAEAGRVPQLEAPSAQSRSSDK